MKRFYILIFLSICVLACSKADQEPKPKFAEEDESISTVAGGNGLGSAANQISNFTGVHVDADGDVYAADHSNLRVQRWPY